MAFLLFSRRRASERRQKLQDALSRPAYESAPSTPEARLADTLLRTALDLEANEFRLTPTETGLRLSMHVGEVWRHPVREDEAALMLPSHLRRGLTVRFKELAELDLLVTRRFQRGRFPLYYYDQHLPVSVEVATEPTSWGEEIRVSLTRELAASSS